MVSRTEIIWRHLLAGTANGQRRYVSVTALARELGIPVSTTHQALERPVGIGAVTIEAVGGLRVLDPVRLLTLYCAHRHLERDIIARSCVDLPVEELERRLSRQPALVIGGFTALVSRTTGVNRIAAYSTVLVYGDESFLATVPLDPNGTSEVVVARADPWLKNYGPLTPAAQAYADIFNLAGWQASRFIQATSPSTVVGGDEPGPFNSTDYGVGGTSSLVSHDLPNLPLSPKGSTADAARLR